MRNKGLSVHHLKLLTQALAKNMLTVLVIRDTSIGDEGVTVVADAIKGTTSLRMLSFVKVAVNVRTSIYLYIVTASPSNPQEGARSRSPQ